MATNGSESVTYSNVGYGVLGGVPTNGQAGPSSGSTTIILLSALPQSPVGLPVNALWNNGGVVCVVV